MIYLDNNSTTPIAPPVLAAMQPFLTEFFSNPSSSHSFGKKARRAIEIAREQVANVLGANNADEIIFTSGGTESTNWAFQIVLKSQSNESSRKNRIVTTKVEHEVVWRNCENLGILGYEIVSLDVDEQGLLSLQDVRQAVNSDTALVSIMQANNETGVLFPVEEIAEIVKEQSDALFHVDGVQAVGKVPLSLAATKIDLYSISGHKFHAPKGIGALFARNNLEILPLFLGGGQERNRRAGTENTASIIGLGAACELVDNLDFTAQTRVLRNHLETEILQIIPNVRINGTADDKLRLPNTSNISFVGIEGESLMAQLDAHQIYISTGSACNSETHTPSSVLRQMNIPYQQAMGAVRFSLSHYTTAEEIDFVLQILPGIVEKLRELSPLVK